MGITMTTQNQITFNMGKGKNRTALVTILGSSVPATADEIVAAANQIQEVTGSKLEEATLIAEGTYSLVSVDDSMHFDCVGNFALAAVNFLGWSREGTTVLEQMPDGATREWRLGYDDGPLDWARLQVAAAE